MLPSPPAEMDYQQVSKRKRSNVEAEEQCDQTFVLTDLVSQLTLSFEPISRLLRAHLPLSWVAPTVAIGNLIPGSLLQGQIQAIGGWEYAVLIARQAPNGGLVSLEKVEEDCFVVYPLQPFVSEKWIRDAAIGASPVVSLQMMLHYLPSPGSCAQADRENTPGAISDPILNVPKNRRGAAARLSILNQAAKLEDDTIFTRTDDGSTQDSSILSGGPPGEISPAPVPRTMEPDSMAFAMTHDTSVQEDLSITPAEPLAGMLSPPYLRQRYLDHLYMTKTSLAYYAKGPLSRARARARAPDSSMKLSDLAAFYRSSILPVKRMDLKYKESIQNIIKKHVSQDIDNPSAKKTTRKTKLGKDGLWPVEPDFVARWWEAKNQEPSSSHFEHSQEMRDDIATLRMREAQMQMVLMLEALSIEAKQRESAEATKHVPEHADVKAESVEHDGLVEAQGLKLRKQRDLEADLEVVADRLCIWHSVGLEGSTLLASNATKKDAEEQVQSKDRLRNFCTDVLMPFYSSRLPHMCRALCKTLAGSEILGQSQKAARIKDISKNKAPGAWVKRRVPSANGKELTRMLSEDDIRLSSPPSLVRSSTLPPLPKFKREASELSQRPPSRSRRQLSVNFGNREIDLVADAHATASKKRKLDKVANHKQDLAAAIEALKKPNRQSASNAYMDEIEQRRPDVGKTTIQITATPKGNRKKSLDSTEFERVFQPTFSRSPAIPAFGLKSNSVGITGTTARPSVKKKAVLAAIHDTPSKRAERKSDPSRFVERLTSDTGSNGMRATNEIPVLSTPLRSRLKSSGSLFDIPPKRQASPIGEQESGFQLPDLALRTMDRAMAMSVPGTIYDSLGWTDDYDV